MTRVLGCRVVNALLYDSQSRKGSVMSRCDSRSVSLSLLAIETLAAGALVSCTASPDTAGPSAAPDAAAAPMARSTDAGPASFTLFESGQVRPLAMSPDKQTLFAVNTPDNRLEIFRITDDRLIRTGSIPVGLEPVAVAARSNREVWVVNHLSDSVSVIALDDDAHSGRVVRTVLVGDEPRDIVF